MAGKAKTPDKLTAAEEKAVQEYLTNGGNQTAAFRKAYPNSKNWKPNTVWTRASELFRQGKVVARLEVLRGLATERAVLKETDLLREAARIAFADIRDLHDIDGQILPMEQWPDALAACVEAVEYDHIPVLGRNGRPTGEVRLGIKKLKLHSKLGAMEKLFKHLGLYEKDNLQKGSFALTGWESLDDEVRGVVLEKLRAIAGAAGRPGVAGTADSRGSGPTTH